MKQLILFLLLLVSGIASAQYSPTSSKTRWINGVGLSSTRDTSLFTSAADTNIVTTWNGNIYWKGTGYWNKIGHSTNVGSQIHDSLYAVYQLKAGTSAGARLVSNSGTVISEWGLGGSANMDFHGFAGYDANRSASYTARSFTDKRYVDSSRALDVQLAGTQTITGSKTFSASSLFNQTAFFTGSFNSSQVTDPAIFIDRSITGGPSSAHGVEDYSLFNQGDGTSGYASYFAKASLEGTRNYDHIRGFQSYPKMNTSGSVQTVESFYSVPTLTQGTLNRLTHFYGGNPSVGTGTVNYQYGLLLDPLTVGATKNWGVFANGTMPNYFGGNVQIGDSTSFSPYYALQVKGSTWAKDASVFHILQSTGAGNNAEVQFKSTARTWDLGVNVNYANNSFELYDRTNAKAAWISTSSRRFIIDTTYDDGANKLQVNGDARVYGNVVANNLSSGTYSPTISGESNVTSVSASTAQYMRVGNVVTVSGRITATPSNTTGAFLFYMTIPVASSFASEAQAGGVASKGNDQTPATACVGAISAEGSGTKVLMTFSPSPTSTSGIFFYSFTYQIL